MGRKEEKMIERFMIKPPPNDITPKELEFVAKVFGFSLIRTKGSHHFFKHNKYPDLARSIAYHGKSIKTGYIKEMQNLIKEVKERNDEKND